MLNLADKPLSDRSYLATDSAAEKRGSARDAQIVINNAGVGAGRSLLSTTDTTCDASSTPTCAALSESRRPSPRSWRPMAAGPWSGNRKGQIAHRREVGETARAGSAVVSVS